MSRSFVVGFAGRRDSYQVPLALAERGLLARCVTTFYLTSRRERVLRGLLRRVPEAAALRRVSGVDDRLVRSLVFPELLEQTGRRVGLSPQRYWPVIDRAISRAAGHEAVRAQADLILYEPYANPAFTQNYGEFTPRRILFHFHPHPDLEAAIYDEDVRRHPPSTPWMIVDAGGNPAVGGSRDAWKHADIILCASTFTKTSLVHAGADAGRIRVIPYGVEASAEVPRRTSDGQYRVLFVGSAIQRKGLHHLLAAWQQGRLPADSELTVVSRTVDPQLAERMRQVPGCRFVAGMNSTELREAYARASVLAVPSLVEGFGQVYLEALSEGCPVLGTCNTGLPDLGREPDGVFLVEPSNVDDLAAMLERLAVETTRDSSLAEAAWRTARRFPWSRFREGVVEAVS